MQQSGTEVHTDSMHSGSAKRNTASGVVGLDASNVILGPGSTLKLTRSAGADMAITEATSSETAFLIHRNGANDYTLYNNTIAGGKIVLDAYNLFATYTDQTSSRADATVYQNTTGKPMLVFVRETSAQTSSATAYSDANADPSGTKVCEGMSYSDSSVSFIVKPTHYYKVTKATNNQVINFWGEWY